MEKALRGKTFLQVCQFHRSDRKIILHNINWTITKEFILEVLELQTEKESK